MRPPQSRKRWPTFCSESCTGGLRLRNTPHRYRLYLNRKDMRREINLVRQTRGRKAHAGPEGSVHNLEQIFEELNSKYFGGHDGAAGARLEPLRSRTRLGHFDPSHNMIVISRIFDDLRAPLLALRIRDVSRDAAPASIRWITAARGGACTRRNSRRTRNYFRNSRKRKRCCESCLDYCNVWLSTPASLYPALATCSRITGIARSTYSWPIEMCRAAIVSRPASHAGVSASPAVGEAVGI